MELLTALTLYAVTLVVVYVILIICHRNWWSALAVAVLVSLFVLLAIYPPNRLLALTTGVGLVYGGVVVLSLIVLSWFILDKGVHDVDYKGGWYNRVCGWFTSC